MECGPYITMDGNIGNHLTNHLTSGSRSSILNLLRDVAQFGRALALGASGRRFKSYHPDCVCINMLHSLEILKSLSNNIPVLKEQMKNV